MACERCGQQEVLHSCGHWRCVTLTCRPAWFQAMEARSWLVPRTLKRMLDPSLFETLGRCEDCRPEGRCLAGDPSAPRYCNFVFKRGTCKFGAKCAFCHLHGRGVSHQNGKCAGEDANLDVAAACPPMGGVSAAMTCLACGFDAPAVPPLPRRLKCGLNSPPPGLSSPPCRQLAASIQVPASGATQEAPPPYSPPLRSGTVPNNQPPQQEAPPPLDAGRAAPGRAPPVAPSLPPPPEASWPRTSRLTRAAPSRALPSASVRREVPPPGRAPPQEAAWPPRSVAPSRAPPFAAPVRQAPRTSHHACPAAGPDARQRVALDQCATRFLHMRFSV